MEETTNQTFCKNSCKAYEYGCPHIEQKELLQEVYILNTTHNTSDKPSEHNGRANAFAKSVLSCVHIGDIGSDRYMSAVVLSKFSNNGCWTLEAGSTWCSNKNQI
eukprot:2626430-Amphidinium_carterae.1